MPTATTLQPTHEIRPVPGKGRGVFAARDLAEGEILDEAPVLLLSAEDAERLEGTALGTHYFHWDGDEKEDGWLGALALGIVTLVNHSANANAGISQDYERQLLSLEALRPIAAGEEILIDYEVELWFEPIEEPSPGAY